MLTIVATLTGIIDWSRAVLLAMRRTCRVLRIHLCVDIVVRQVVILVVVRHQVNTSSINSSYLTYSVGAIMACGCAIP